MKWCLINHRDSFTFALSIMYPTVHMIPLYVDRWTDSCMVKVIGTYLCSVMNECAKYWLHNLCGVGMCSFMVNLLLSKFC